MDSKNYCSSIPDDDMTILSIIKDAVALARENSRDSILCFLVGGYVRDLLSGKKPKDIDCVCSNLDKLIISLESILDDKGIKHKKSVYEAFGTVLVHFLDQDIEFVIPRKESYRDYQSRNPTIEPGTFAEDASRRDFTVNAIYLSLNPENFCKIVDLTNRGIQDLRSNLLDTPLDPDETFTQDPLRMMRAARFIAVKGFIPSVRIVDSCRRNASRLSIIVPERIQEEMRRSISSPDYFRVLDDLGLVDTIFPEMKPLRRMKQSPLHHKYDVFEHTMRVVECLPAALRFAGLYHDAGKIISLTTGNFHDHEDLSGDLFVTRFTKLRFPKDFIDYNEALIRGHMRIMNLAFDENRTKRAVRRFMADNREWLDDLVTLATCDKQGTGVDVGKGISVLRHLKKEMDGLSSSVLVKITVTGKDLMEMLGLSEGKEVGRIKADIVKKIEEGDLENDKDSIRKYVLKTYGSCKQRSRRDKTFPVAIGSDTMGVSLGKRSSGEDSPSRGRNGQTEFRG